jgi:phosphatidylethanolamine-binding protein (PEBP) family uncharacterized protein
MLSYTTASEAVLVSLVAKKRNTTTSKGEKTVNILITSDAFLEGETIPTKYTCDGDDLSPDLRWSDIPPNTRSLALICEDPDAPSGTFTHWVLFDLPPTVTELPEGVCTYKRKQAQTRGA